VVFEVTETALIQNEGVAQVFIENARRLNCGVALMTSVLATAAFATPSTFRSACSTSIRSSSGTSTAQARWSTAMASRRL